MRHMLQRCISALLAAAAFHAQAATFTITHFGTPANAQLAIQRAADIWGGILVSDVPIKVSVQWVSLGASALGVTFPNGRKDFASAPLPATWYATALANSIADTELNPGQDDINVYLNASSDWYYGLDGNTPAGQYDLVSVALHELGHGLGFVGLAKKVGSEGSFGLLQQSDFAPLITTFPWPQQDTLPGIFDRFLRAPTLEMLVDVPNPSVPLGSFLTCNQLQWIGSFGLVGSGGADIRIYSPPTFALGSSCVHLNETTYPVGNANELMTPFSTAGHANHWPGPICLGIMQDIGWVVNPVSVQELAHEGSWSVSIGSDDHLRCTGLRQGERIRILDSQGRTLLEDAHDRLPLLSLASGSYLALRMSTGSGRRLVLP